MGALPPAVAKSGLPVAVITPLYGRLKTNDHPLRLVAPDCPVGYPWEPITAEIYQAQYRGVTVYFVQRDEYFDRRAYYNTYKGDYFDNCERFNFFCRAALQWLRRLGTPPQVIHVNDWQTALATTWVHFLRKYDPFWARTKTVLTIHNLAFQGRYSSRLFNESGLPAEAWNMDGCEYYGDFNLLKSGIAYSDMITTVSPSYAEEILTPQFGCGLEGILQKRRESIRGILNGADYDVWAPEADRYLPSLLFGGAYDRKDVVQTQTHPGVLSFGHARGQTHSGIHRTAAGTKGHRPAHRHHSPADENGRGPWLFWARATCGPRPNFWT